MVKWADAPRFCHTASIQVGSGRCSKPLKHSDGFKISNNMIIDITQEYLKAVIDIVNSWFKIEISAKISKNRQTHLFVAKV